MLSSTNHMNPEGPDSGLPVRSPLGRKNRRHGVELRFDGLAEPVAALAALDGDELCISAPLALLRAGTGVRFRFESGPVFGGQVEDVSLAQRGSTPVLSARIAVGTVHREAFREQASGLAGGDLTEEANVRGPQPAARDRRLTRWLPAIRAGMLGFVCGFAVWGLETGGFATSPLASPVPTPRDSISPVSISPVSISPVSTWANAATIQQTSPSVAGDGSGPLLEPSSVAFSQAAEHRTMAKLDSLSVDDLVIRRHGSTLELEMPAAVAPKVLRHFRLASPPGIGIDLAEPLQLAPGKYPIYRKGILWLRVVETNAGIRLRIFLSNRPESYQVRVLERALGLAIDER